MLRFNLIRSYRTSAHLVRASRRLLSTVSQQDAFLEAVPKHSGIVSLALNRPQAKNAISVNLLKVIFTLEQYIPSIYFLQQQLTECLEEAHFDKRFVLAVIHFRSSQLHI